EARAGVMKEVENAFKPEFINRIDKVVMFQPLSQADLESIVRLQMAELGERLKKDYRVGLTWSAQAVSRIAEKSWNPLYGARGVRRQIQDLIENPLAKELLADGYRTGDTMAVGLKDDQIVIVRKKAATKQKSHA
ncbi:MAG: hypothetical protein RL272_1078, partial [Candidatus Parcubacteria bacterium]